MLIPHAVGVLTFTHRRKGVCDFLIVFWVEKYINILMKPTSVTSKANQPIHEKSREENAHKISGRKS